MCDMFTKRNSIMNERGPGLSLPYKSSSLKTQYQFMPGNSAALGTRANSYLQSYMEISHNFSECIKPMTIC